MPVLTHLTHHGAVKTAGNPHETTLFPAATRQPLSQQNRMKPQFFGRHPKFRFFPKKGRTEMAKTIEQMQADIKRIEAQMREAKKRAVEQKITRLWLMAKQAGLTDLDDDTLAAALAQAKTWADSETKRQEQCR